MKWFIKCLKHYADFSGRARRKEYWMFLLFNIIFSLVWAILAVIVIKLSWGIMTAIAVKRHGFSNIHEPIAINITNLCYYSAAMLLPGLAVTVRRLHDTGKSGWMLLVGLIPVVGAIWLLVLLLADSQPEANEYGPNPKTSPEMFSEPARLKSVGVTLIIASIVSILLLVFGPLISGPISNMPIKRYFPYLLRVFMIFPFASIVALLVAGILLLKATLKMEGETKNAIIAVVAATVISFLLSAKSAFSLMNATLPLWSIKVDYFIRAVCFLPVILFAASLLLSPSNKDFIRIAAVLTIVFSGLHLLWKVWHGMIMAVIDPVISLIGTPAVLLPIAFIVLAGTFYPKK